MNEIEHALAEYKRWCEYASDSEVKSQLEMLKDNSEELIESFYGDLKFGTSGIRGILGAGTNRMNIYVVRRTTQGLSNYLIRHYENPSVVIACDSRKNSRLFAEETAKVLSGNNIKAYVFDKITPVSVLSYSIEELGCTMGIMITASHNPKVFNGYKVYNSDGYQVVGDVPSDILEEINKVDFFSGINFSEDKIERLGDEIGEKFVDDVTAMCSFDISKDAFRDLSIVYTPLNGAGSLFVQGLFAKNGFDNIHVVSEQEFPDENFTTCPVPNPEKPGAYKCAFQHLDNVNGDIIIATDPDSDRVGAALVHDGMKVLLSGNQIGILMLKFLCEHKAIKEGQFIMKSIVSTPLAEKIAESFGISTINTLTGFKYIGEQITTLMKKGEEDRYFFGFEESNGFLISPFIRDKDGVSSALIIAMMAAEYKAKGMDLIEGLEEIYREYGTCIDKTNNFVFEGLSGIEIMKNIMKYFREDVNEKLGSLRILEKTDYLAEDTGLPKSNVIGLCLEDGSSVIIRPSGTEPKIKVYMFTPEGHSKAEKEIKKIMSKF